jgi:hypothetical protein
MFLLFALLEELGQINLKYYWTTLFSSAQRKEPESREGFNISSEV